MAFFFLDTSALAKRYLLENGSQWIVDLFAEEEESLVYIAEVTLVELTSAIVRRSKGGSLTPTDVDTLLNAFDRHLSTDYLIVEVTSSLLHEARVLARSLALKGYDAVQLAVAVAVNKRQTEEESPITFVSADDELLAAAGQIGLAVENPNYHTEGEDNA